MKFASLSSLFLMISLVACGVSPQEQSSSQLQSGRHESGRLLQKSELSNFTPSHCTAHNIDNTELRTFAFNQALVCVGLMEGGTSALSAVIRTLKRDPRRVEFHLISDLTQEVYGQNITVFGGSWTSFDEVYGTIVNAGFLFTINHQKRNLATGRALGQAEVTFNGYKYVEDAHMEFLVGEFPAGFLD